MHLLAIVLFTVASGLLVVSGAAKVLQPGSVAGALGTLGLRLPRWSGVVLGLGELGLGSAGLLVAGRVPALLVGLGYGAFAVVVAVMIRRGESSSCGCFGALDSPPSAIHLGFDVIASASALGLAADGGWAGFPAFAAGLPGGIGLYGAFLVIAVGASVGLLTVLPTVVERTSVARTAADARYARLHPEHHGLSTPLQVTERS